MNHDDFTRDLIALDVNREFGERDILVIDEEGFQHSIQGVFWDPDDGCFWVRTKFLHARNGDTVEH